MLDGDATASLTLAQGLAALGPTGIQIAVMGWFARWLPKHLERLSAREVERDKEFRAELAAERLICDKRFDRLADQQAKTVEAQTQLTNAVCELTTLIEVLSRQLGHDPTAAAPAAPAQPVKGHQA
jgi:hypothetical protein